MSVPWDTIAHGLGAQRDVLRRLLEDDTHAADMLLRQLGTLETAVTDHAAALRSAQPSTSRDRYSPPIRGPPMLAGRRKSLSPTAAAHIFESVVGVLSPPRRSPSSAADPSDPSRALYAFPDDDRLGAAQSFAAQEEEYAARSALCLSEVIAFAALSCMSARHLVAAQVFEHQALSMADYIHRHRSAIALHEHDAWEEIELNHRRAVRALDAAGTGTRRRRTTVDRLL